MTEEKSQNIIDLEDQSKSGKPAPKGERYRIRIDKKKFEVDVSQMTGRELLVLSGNQPPEDFALYLRNHGGAQERVQLDQIVEFTTPGLERFLTLPLDQTEGEL